jgi:hypothetical protein
MGFFDTPVQEDAKKSETVTISIPEKSEPESVSAFFATPEETPAESDDGAGIVILDDSETKEEPVVEELEIEEPTPLFAANISEPETALEPVATAPAAAPAPHESDTDAGAIILEAIVKMTALHDRKAETRDSIMAEVEDINAQIAMLKDKAKDRTGRAKDIASEMKKIEESIAVLQTQKAA